MPRPDHARTAPTAPFELTDAHQKLARMVGTWSGTTRTWFDPPSPPEESEIEATVDSLLGGRWIRIEARGTAAGKPHAGQMILGFHRDEQSYEMSWIDSFHTGTAIMLFTGPAVPDDRPVAVTGSYRAGDERWGWRTEFAWKPSAELWIQAWNISPDGHEERAIETILSPAM